MQIYCDLMVGNKNNVYFIGAELIVEKEPIKVCSLYVVDDAITSTYTAIMHAIYRVLEELPEGYTEVIFRSRLPHFLQSDRILRKAGPYIKNRNIEVYLIKTNKHSRNLLALCNDALERGHDVIADI